MEESPDPGTHSQHTPQLVLLQQLIEGVVLFSVFSTARANNTRVCFTYSVFDSSVDVGTRSGSQSCGFANQLGPCHQRAGKYTNISSPNPHVRWILLCWYMPPVNLFFLNLPYSISHELFVFAISTDPVQCYWAIQTTINTSYGKTLKTSFRFAAICPANSSKRGIVSPFITSRDSAVTRP